jgi:hypothetical protein
VTDDRQTVPYQALLFSLSHRVSSPIGEPEM